MILFKRSLLMKTLIAFHLQYTLIHSSQMVSSEMWRKLMVNPDQIGAEIVVVAEEKRPSVFTCAFFAGDKGVNTFCYQDENCKLLHVHSCPLYDKDSNNKPMLKCFSTLKFLDLRARIKRTGILNKYAGCVWPAKVGVSWFKHAVQLCKEDGGQLMTFERFPTAKDLTDFTSILNYKNDNFIGLFRNGSTADFQWLTGTVISKSSELWHSGEPSSDKLEMACGMLWEGKLDDHLCYKIKPDKVGYCQIYFPM